MSKNAVIVFMRNPELGKVKTRLSKDIGPQSALNIYKFLLSHTEKTIRQLNVDKAIFYSEKILKEDIWDSNIYLKFQQKGEEFGERMFNAFQSLFENNYEKLIIIGSDLFHLNSNHLVEAFDHLDSFDYVVGPATDGGYYLLGMKKMYSKLFHNKKWGSSTVLYDTLKDIEPKSVLLLEELNDIDTYKDLMHIPELLKLISNE